MRPCIGVFLICSIAITNINAKLFTRCELFDELNLQGFPQNEIPKWVCLVEAVSQRNTSKYTTDGMWGLYQIYGKYWCNENEKIGGCDVDCNKLLSEDITDSSRCARLIQSQQGFEAWGARNGKCLLSDADFSECHQTYRTVSCTLPPYPKNGRYTVVGDPTLVPGGVVPVNSAISSNCDRDHSVQYPSTLYCLSSGAWSGDLQCSKNCPRLTSFFVVKCYNGIFEVPCHSNIQHGTIAIVLCPDNMQAMGEMQCNNGIWKTNMTNCELDKQETTEAAIIPLQSKSMVGSSPKVYTKCELAEELINKGFPENQLRDWICVAQSGAQFNVSYRTGPNTIGNYEWGIFRINDRFWCGINEKGGDCNIKCEDLLDISGAAECAKIIHQKHGFAGWATWTDFCKQSLPDLSECGIANVLTRCELAREFERQGIESETIPNWVCLAEAASQGNTSLLTDSKTPGFHNWGLFQINDRFWCKNGTKGGDCNVDCTDLVRNDITESLGCAKIIHRRHGFEGWAQWLSTCQNGPIPDLSECGLKRAQIETTTKCVLPTYPNKGSYKVQQNSNLKPGAAVDAFTLLEYTCDDNYTLSSSPLVHCMNDSRWTNIPECIKKCKPLTSLTVEFTCYTNNKRVPCNEPLEDGTIATMKCNNNHYTTENLNKMLHCVRGIWNNPIPSCRPECGLEKGDGTGLIIGGKESRRGEFPWHLGVYSLISNPEKFTQICGGTIITVKVAMSAAHCFWNTQSNRLFPESLYTVAAGKFNRDYYDEEDEKYQYVQKSNLDQIIVPESYGGSEQRQQSDVALLILSTPFKFSESVHPICIELGNGVFDQSQTARGNFGKGAGWGVTTEGGEPSSILKVIEIPVVDYTDCKNRMPFEFQPFLTFDKFCAGFLNGTTMCSGDSGGGLVFKTRELDTDRWYLRGIVSVGASSTTTNTCRKNTYTGFTRVFSHREWIVGILDEYK